MENDYSITPNNTPYPASIQKSSKIPLITILILVIAVILQLVTLIVLISRPTLEQNSDSAEIAADAAETEEIQYTTSSNYTYDEAGNLTAFNVTCESNVGAQIKFTGENDYQAIDPMENLISSGKYEFVEKYLIKIMPNSAAEKALYFYEGNKVADGLDIYTCKETLNNA